MMEFTAKELRFLAATVSRAIKDDRHKLESMDEDTDEYMELANDLMLLDVILSKLKSAE